MIFAVACESVEESGRPVARWTQRELIDEVVQRGIVKSISTSHLSTLLAEAQWQPHNSRYWLNTKESDPEVFHQQVQTVCECYLQAAELLAAFDTHTVCINEMTGIQALERIAPKKRCGPDGMCRFHTSCRSDQKPGAEAPQNDGHRPEQEERIEFEYIRHGTQCLIASFIVVTGESVSPTVGPTRTEEDFLGHCKRTIMLHPNSWRLIMDQLSTHGSESLVRWVVAMEELKLSVEELGVKGTSGILTSLATRKSISHRRIGISALSTFPNVPKHSSWLNQVEIWFSVIVHRAC